MPTVFDPSDFFLTKVEFDPRLVKSAAYYERLYIAVDTAPAAVDGVQIIIVDTTGGPVTVTLEDALTAPSRYSPIIVNVGPGVLTIEATINGVLDPTVITQYAAMVISISQNAYLSSLKVTT
jgi:hypothetical protein